MGTHCLIVVIEQDQDEDGTVVFLNPLCAILRTSDGNEALDTALEVADESIIVNGIYDGMPDTEFNGAGAFALRLIDRIRRGWEDYTTLVPPSEFIAEGGLDAGDFEMSIAIYVPRIEGPVTHSHYERPE